MIKLSDELNGVTAEIIEEVGEENILAFAVVIVHKQGKGINWTAHAGVDSYPEAAECCEALNTMLADLETQWGLNMGRAQGTA